MARKNITLRNIADSAGVTVSTVSAALNSTGRISDALRSRIGKTASRMGYQPNMAAQLLRSKRSANIGMIVNDRIGNIRGSGYFQPLIAEFIETCHKEGLRNHIEFWDSSANTEKLPWLLSSGFVGGIVHAGRLTPDIARWLRKNPDFPLVEIGEAHRHSVRSRIDNGSYQAVRHLMALGHRRIAMACGPGKYDMHSQILKGFKRAVADFGVSVESEGWIRELELASDRSAMLEGLEWTLSLLDGGKERPTAAIGADMRLARAVIHGAGLRGLKVPEDLSVVGVGAAYDADQCLPSVSTIELDFGRIMEEAVTLLRRLMNRQEIHSSEIWCEVKFVERDSTAHCKT
ncbi:MAG: LacI family DNA-binding transcriptional regulator [Victivallales bacterium]